MILRDSCPRARNAPALAHIQTSAQMFTAKKPANNPFPARLPLCTISIIMATPARMLELETFVEDVSELKADIRLVGAKVDEVDRRLTARIDAVKTLLDTKTEAITAAAAAQALATEKSFARVEKSIADLALSTEKSFGEFRAGMEKSFGELRTSMEKSFGELRTDRMKDRIWWLLITATVLGLVGRALKWF